MIVLYLAIPKRLAGGPLDLAAGILGRINGICRIGTDAADGVAAAAERKDGGTKGDGKRNFGGAHDGFPG